MIALEHQEKMIQIRKNKIKQYQKSLNEIIYLKEHPFEKQKIDTECIISFDLTNLQLLKKYIENPYLYSRIQHSDYLDQEERGMTIFKREYQKDDRLLWESQNHDYIVCLMKEEHKEGYPNDLKELASYVQETYQTGYVISRFLGMINEDGKVYDFFKTYIEIIKKNGALNKCRVPTKKL